MPLLSMPLLHYFRHCHFIISFAVTISLHYASWLSPFHWLTCHYAIAAVLITARPPVTLITDDHFIIFISHFLSLFLFSPLFFDVFFLSLMLLSYAISSFLRRHYYYFRRHYFLHSPYFDIIYWCCLLLFFMLSLFRFAMPYWCHADAAFADGHFRRLSAAWCRFSLLMLITAFSSRRCYHFFADYFRRWLLMLLLFTYFRCHYLFSIIFIDDIFSLWLFFFSLGFLFCVVFDALRLILFYFLISPLRCRIYLHRCHFADAMLFRWYYAIFRHFSLITLHYFFLLMLIISPHFPSSSPLLWCAPLIIIDADVSLLFSSMPFSRHTLFLLFFERVIMPMMMLIYWLLLFSLDYFSLIFAIIFDAAADAAFLRHYFFFADFLLDYVFSFIFVIYFLRHFSSIISPLRDADIFAADAFDSLASFRAIFFLFAIFLVDCWYVIAAPPCPIRHAMMSLLCWCFFHWFSRRFMPCRYAIDYYYHFFITLIRCWYYDWFSMITFRLLSCFRFRFSSAAADASRLFAVISFFIVFAILIIDDYFADAAFSLPCYW